MKKIFINALGGAVAFGLFWSFGNMIFDNNLANDSGIYGGICFFVVGMLIALIRRGNRTNE
ncbi:hypothetical protein [Paenibacillus aceris]|uniref:DUF3188 domain-containing protein n=1 Tax=Paenibacillus aceris TaxID=869555 RepID=A0ABS4HXM9_9BACL|nr:hypothetical protein [Paenibacillus aceris]MBP1963393.1 hypothetical protein [Paenibacillus aceris]NHW36099.1 hypothetical protein [Paenibacillus aceris]